MVSSTTLIAGAMGPIGRFLVQELADRGIPTRLFTRETSEALSVSSNGRADFDPGGSPESPDTLLADVDHIVLLSSPAPDTVMWNGTLIEAAERTGRSIHLIPVLAMGAVSTDPSLQFARWHAVTLAQMQSTDLPVTAVYPQILMQNFLHTAASIRNDNLLFGSYGGSRFPHVDARDVAAVLAVLVTDPSADHDGNIYALTGPQALSYQEVTADLSAILGRPLRYVDMPPETFHEHLIGGGMPHWKADDLVELARLFQRERAWPVSATVAELTGRPARTLQQFFREHAEHFAPRPDALPQDLFLPSLFLL